MVKKPVFEEHKGKSKKLTNKQMKEIMKELFGTAEAEMTIAIDAIAQAVMTKYYNQLHSGSEMPKDSGKIILGEIAVKWKALEAIVFSNYFKGGDNGTEAEDTSDAGEGVDESPRN